MSAIALFQQKIGHTLKTSNPVRKSSLIKAENMLDNSIFLGFCENISSVAAIRSWRDVVHSVAKGSLGDSVNLGNSPAAEFSFFFNSLDGQDDATFFWEVFHF